MTPRSAVLLQRLSRGRPLGHTGKPAAAGVFERHDPGVRGRRQLPDLHLAGEHPTTVTISASGAGVTNSAILTVDPTPASPTSRAHADLAGLRCTLGRRRRGDLDWSDVTGASRYALEVSRSNTFSTTVVNQTALTASQLSTTSLPKADLFWRLRGFDSAANPGT